MSQGAMPEANHLMTEEGVSTGLFCVADQKIHTDWTYVGEGKGAFTQQQVYNFVGEQRGSFDKHETKTYSHWRPRLCTLVLLGIAAVALAVFALVQYLTLGSATDASTCGAQDCLCGFHTGWEDDKKVWCCQNHGMGCPPDNSMQPMTGIGKLASPLQGCATKCELKGISADCSARVNFASEHRFQMDPNKCQSAYELVKQQCIFCSLCPVESTGCGVPTPLSLVEMQNETVRS